MNNLAICVILWLSHLATFVVILTCVLLSEDVGVYVAMIGYWLLVPHIFTLANLYTDSMSRRRTSSHLMASDPTVRGSDASLSEEEAMATFYSIEREHAQGDDELNNGIYRHNARKSLTGYPKAGSSQSVCKYRHSLPRRPCFLHVVECKVRFVRWTLWALDLETAFITTCFGRLIWQVTGISKCITSNGRSREWLMEIVNPRYSATVIHRNLWRCTEGGGGLNTVQEGTSVHRLRQALSEGGAISGFECSLKQGSN
jgi:hypothetical protein